MAKVEMSVLEKSRDRLVLKTSGQKRVLGGFLLAAGVVCLIISLATGWLADSPFWRGVWVALGALFLLYGSYTLVSSKTVTADRLTEVVEVQTIHLGLWSRSTKVSFSQVEYVDLEYREGRTGGDMSRGHDTWTVYVLCSQFRRAEVCSGEDEHMQLEIASALSHILDKELRRTKSGPGIFERLLSAGQGNDDRRRPPPGYTPPY